MTPGPETSRDKKRVRDRRAQIARRVRQSTHLTKLETIADHCKRHHNDEELQRLSAELEALRIENATLKSRQAKVISVLQGVTEVDSLQLVEHVEDESKILSPQRFVSIGDASWATVPLNVPHSERTGILMPWLLYPAIVRDAPDAPTGLDILYGSHTNPLANSIHIAMICARFSTMGDPERLAFGWLIYVYVKWLFDPTPERFQLVPDFLRPTSLQKSQAHPAVLDAVLWPQVRDNMIMKYREDSDDIIDALRCQSPELAVPWPRITPILLPDKDQPGEYFIDKQFLQTFTNLENWTLSDRFVTQYSDLVKGSEYEITE